MKKIGKVELRKSIKKLITSKALTYKNLSNEFEVSVVEIKTILLDYNMLDYIKEQQEKFKQLEEKRRLQQLQDDLEKEEQRLEIKLYINELKDNNNVTYENLSKLCNLSKDATRVRVLKLDLLDYYTQARNETLVYNYIINEEKLKEKRKQQYQENKDEIIKKSLKYYYEHKEQQYETKKEWQQKETEKVNKYANDYYYRNREKIIARNNAYKKKIK